MRTRYMLMLFVLLLLAFGGLARAQSQTIITMTAPQWMAGYVEDSVIPAFEEANPDVSVQYRYPNDQRYYGKPRLNDEQDVTTYLDDIGARAGHADVQFIESRQFGPLQTRAGYALDLAPMADADSMLNPDSFFPAAWDAFRWDGGMWALPVGMDVQVVTYNKPALDAAGISYPDASWTALDYFDAVIQFNANRPEDHPPIRVDAVTLLSSAAPGAAYDASTFPNAPDFTNPEIVDLAEAWMTWMTHQEDASEMRAASGGTYNQPPALQIGSPRYVLRDDDSASDWGITLLPGGHAGLNVRGFMVSGGTSNPEAAYRLTRYLTTDAGLANRIGADRAARRNLDTSQMDEQVLFGPSYPPKVESFLQDAYENALPPSEARFMDYLGQLPSYYVDRSQPLREALGELEADLRDALATADRRADENPISVKPAEPERQLAAGEVAVDVGLTRYNDTERRTAWDSFFDRFIETNDLVGDVNVDTEFFTQDGIDPAMDCFVTTESQARAIRDAFDSDGMETVLPVDPLTATDADFNRDDFLPGVLQSTSQDSTLMGYPVAIQPVVMLYHVPGFEDAGVPLPDDGWTINDFESAVRALASDWPDDRPLMRTEFGTNALALRMLTASYGGLYYDHSVEPRAVQFADEATINAARDALGLARDGIIDYRRMVVGSGSGGVSSMSSLERPTPLIVDRLSPDSYRIRQYLGTTDNSFMGYDDYRLMLFPAGSQYAPATYDVTALYITPNAPEAERQACYDLGKSLASDVTLFNGMPARASLLNAPELETAQGEDVVAFYRDYAEQLQQPSATLIPSEQGSFANITEGLETLWLHYAFDQAILDNVDVGEALRSAAESIQQYRACTAGLPSLDYRAVMRDPQVAQDAIRPYVDCAVNITPAFREQFGSFYQGE